MPRLTAAVLVSVLCSCAAMDRHVRETMCSPDAAFQQGMNDGRAGREMDQGFTDVCAPSDAPAVRSAYRDGYQSGLASRVAEAQAAASGGAQLGRGWTCEVSAFAKTYSAPGATEAEASARARARCTEKESDMFCRDVSCREGG